MRCFLSPAAYRLAGPEFEGMDQQWVDFFLKLIYNRIVKVIESQIKIIFFYNLFFSSKIYFLQ